MLYSIHLSPIKIVWKHHISVLLGLLPWFSTKFISNQHFIIKLSNIAFQLTIKFTMFRYLFNCFLVTELGHVAFYTMYVFLHKALSSMEFQALISCKKLHFPRIGHYNVLALSTLIQIARVHDLIICLPSLLEDSFVWQFWKTYSESWTVDKQNYMDSTTFTKAGTR